MKSITFVSSNELTPWGGSEMLWTLAAQRFAERQYRVRAGVKWCRTLPEKIAELKEKGAAVYVRGEVPISAAAARTNRLLPARLQFKPRSAQFDVFRDGRPDLVVISQGGNFDGIDYMEYCVRYKIPFVTVSQAASEFYWPDDKMVSRLEKAYPSALKNFFVSNATRLLTEQMVGQSLGNTGLVHNPFNVPYDALVPYPSITEGYRLANVARYELYAKGQDIFLQVLAERKWRERSLSVSMYGQGMHSGLIKKLIKYYGLIKVAQEGYQPTLDIWRRCHALLLTSRYEGLPLSLVEAMLCARTAVVTRVSGNTEVLEDNVHGFVAKAPTAELVDEAMERAWQQRQKWQAMGVLARAYVSKIVPEDPVSIFCAEIESLLSS